MQRLGFYIGWLTTLKGVGWLAVFFYSLHFIVGMRIPQISGGEVTAGEEKNGLPTIKCNK